jgi:two-component system cell cycle response regulator
MPDTDAGVASIVAERIRNRVAGEPFAIHKGARAIDVTVSIGMAQRLGGDTDADTILKRADQALYRAKRDGRNRVVLDAA